MPARANSYRMDPLQPPADGPRPEAPAEDTAAAALFQVPQSWKARRTKREGGTGYMSFLKSASAKARGPSGIAPSYVSGAVDPALSAAREASTAEIAASRREACGLAPSTPSSAVTFQAAAAER